MVLEHILLQAINQVAWRDFRAPSFRIVGEQLTFVSLLLVLPLLPPQLLAGTDPGGAQHLLPNGQAPCRAAERSLVLGHAKHPAGSVPKRARFRQMGDWGGMEEGLSFLKCVL